MSAPHRIEPWPKKFATVGGKRMAYVELGAGEPVYLFLHGNPTSSYLWRNVMPQVAGRGRCLAPDLIGMGDSDKLDDAGDAYSFTVHRDYLWGFIDAIIGTDKAITTVGHDWGSALGFDWANHHRDRVAGMVYMEAIVRPLTWSEWPEASHRVFQGFRSPAGEKMILDDNMFVERVLPAAILRPPRWTNIAAPSPDRTSTAGRRSPGRGKSRSTGNPLRSRHWSAVMPSGWLKTRSPSSFVNAEPGAILVGAQREFCRGWCNQSEVTVAGNHFIQEDSGTEIGQAIAAWSDRPHAPSTAR